MAVYKEIFGLNLNKIRFLKKFDLVIGPILVKLLSALPIKKIPINDVKQVLFIRPGGIGDAVLLCPIISLIKSTSPGSSVDVLAETRNSTAFTLCPEIGKVYCYDRLPEFFACVRKTYDVIIDTEQWHRLSAAVARLIRAKHRIGFAVNERSRLFHQAPAYTQNDYELTNFLRLIDSLVGSAHKVSMPYLHIPAEDRRRSEALLPVDLNCGFVTIFPGASIPERRWHSNNFARLAGLFKEWHMPVVVVGGSGDWEAGENIVAAGWGINLAGKTSLIETAAIVDRSELLVSGDSGILHVGVGLGKSTVSLFGPGIAQKWAPRGGDHIVLNKNMPCSPCTRFGYMPECPLKAKCMSDISVDEVFRAAITLLKRNQTTVVN